MYPLAHNVMGHTYFYWLTGEIQMLSRNGVDMGAELQDIHWDPHRCSIP